MSYDNWLNQYNPYELEAEEEREAERRAKKEARAERKIDDLNECEDEERGVDDE